jgi:phosphate starvation-inducible membrane PsiE
MTERSLTGVKAARRLRTYVDPLGYFFSEAFHIVGLFAIGASTVWAAFNSFRGMIDRGEVRLDELLLLFIYLEIGSMVGIYFRTNHLPVRFLIYVGITALTRHLIVYVQSSESPTLGVLILAGGTLILALAVLILRYASFHYPTTRVDDA